MRFSPAIRDILIHADFPNKPLGAHDAYPMSANGDTISWVHVAAQYAISPASVADRRKEVLRFTADDAKAQAMLDTYYFHPRVMQAIRGLRDEAARDGTRIVVVALDYATSMAIHDADFDRGKARYFERLSREYGATLVNAMPDFTPDPY